MIEVIRHGNAWVWRMISDAGRVLAYGDATFPCDMSAADAARAYRSAFWATACRIDHRMAACV